MKKQLLISALVASVCTFGLNAMFGNRLGSLQRPSLPLNAGTSVNTATAIRGDQIVNRQQIVKAAPVKAAPLQQQAAQPIVKTAPVVKAAPVVQSAPVVNTTQVVNTAPLVTPTAVKAAKPKVPAAAKMAAVQGTYSQMSSMPGASLIIPEGASSTIGQGFGAVGAIQGMRQ